MTYLLVFLSVKILLFLQFYMHTLTLTLTDHGLDLLTKILFWSDIHKYFHHVYSYWIKILFLTFADIIVWFKLAASKPLGAQVSSWWSFMESYIILNLGLGLRQTYKSPILVILGRTPNKTPSTQQLIMANIHLRLSGPISNSLGTIRIFRTKSWTQGRTRRNLNLPFSWGTKRGISI